MLNIESLNLQYITDETGKRKAVILPIEEFIELIEDLEDLAVIAERKDEKGIPFSEVIEQLKNDGLLPG